MDAYWRAAKLFVRSAALSAGQSAFESALRREHIKKRLLDTGDRSGTEFCLCAYEPRHQGIRPEHDPAFGTGHGGNFFVSNAIWRVPTVRFIRTSGRTREGLTKLLKSSSRSRRNLPAMWRRKRRAPSTRGGELGYSLAHARSARFDNPDLIAACVVGDGEAETGPAGDGVAFLINFLSAKHDGAVLPIPSEGYKDQQSTVFARISPQGERVL